MVGQKLAESPDDEYNTGKPCFGPQLPWRGWVGKILECSMTQSKCVSFLIVSFLTWLPYLSAQNKLPVPPLEKPKNNTYFHQAPCWEEVGIPRSVMLQRK